MKKIFQTLYLFLYCAVLVKGLRHYRANIAMSVSVAMYTIDFCVFVYIYFEFYNTISGIQFTSLLAFLSLTTGFVTKRFFEKRSVYGAITVLFNQMHPQKKRIYGAIGLIFFLGSFGGLIIASLLPKWL
jgi:hypothetical protein